MQDDGQFAIVWHQRYLVDQRPEGLGGAGAAVLVLQVFVELADPLRIECCHVRMQQGRRLVGIGQFLRQFSLAGFQLLGLVLQFRQRETLHDRVDDLVQFLVDTLQFPLPTLQVGAALDAQPVHLFGELGAKLLEQRRLHQMFPEAVQDRGFQRIAADVEPVVAGALVAGCRAAKQVLRDHRIATPAAAAFDQAREEMLRAPAVVHEVGGLLGFGFIGKPTLAFLHGRPDIVGNDPQFGDLLRHPFGFRVQAGDAPPGIGIFDVAQPVPDQPADIEFVVQDAGATFRIAVDGRWPPFSAHGARNMLAIQRHGDRARGLAIKVVSVDAAHDPGFCFVDGPVATHGLAAIIELLHHVVTVAEPATRLAVLDSTA